VTSSQLEVSRLPESSSLMALGETCARDESKAPEFVELFIEQSAGYRSNSNLEEISDWLTKILVGLGLIELGRIGPEQAASSTSSVPPLGQVTRRAQLRQ
jgi:hypothetical protein